MYYRPSIRMASKQCKLCRELHEVAMGDVKARPLYRACLSNDGPKVSWLRRVPGGTLLGRRHRLRNGHPPDQQDPRGVPRPHDAGEMQLLKAS